MFDSIFYTSVFAVIETYFYLLGAFLTVILRNNHSD